MKVLKVSKKLDFGIKTRFYAFKEFVKLEIDDKFSFVKICIHVDVIEGSIDKFDLERWERFIKSDEKMIFEICIL